MQAQERQERKRRRVDAGDYPVSGAVRPSRGLGGFLRRTARSMMDMPWQIVQVSVCVERRGVCGWGGGGEQYVCVCIGCVVCRDVSVRVCVLLHVFRCLCRCCMSVCVLFVYMLYECVCLLAKFIDKI